MSFKINISSMNLEWKIVSIKSFELIPACTVMSDSFPLLYFIRSSLFYYFGIHNLSQKKGLDREMSFICDSQRNVCITLKGDTLEMWTISWNVIIQDADSGWNMNKLRTKYYPMLAKYCIWSTYLLFNRHRAVIFKVKQYIQYYCNIYKFITLFCLHIKANLMKLHLS